MTKDWESVRHHIRELSVDQKKSLEDVKTIMESRHRFRASTRAYRMKLKEWGYLRHKPRKTRNGTQSTQDGESSDESDESTTVPDTNVILLEEAQNLLPAIVPWAHAGAVATDVVMDMLAAVLEADSQKLEAIIQKNPNHVNFPIGLPFDVHGGRFFSHPAMQQCVVLQHAEQTLLDIASSLPTGPVVWVLLAHGAKGSTHPLGTDLALHNAIKNGRTYTVQALLHTGGSNPNGVSGTSWRPLLQAAFWNVPDVVRLLLDKGAHVNDTAPPLDGVPFKTALQLVLDRRAKDYNNLPVKQRCEKIMKMLLDAGADIHVPPAEDLNGLTAFETFIKPWQASAWSKALSATEIECLEAFVRKGADLQTLFVGFPCCSSTGNTFEHQVLWHSTPMIARLLVDHAHPNPSANGQDIMHEIIGACPDAKRHPADTHRDMEILLRRGADPNLPRRDGFSPLTACIKFCPAVDVVNRLEVLLEGGADPELRDNNGARPIVLAARAFDEPVLSQVMHSLVSKFRGRQPDLDQSRWIGGYLPIQNDPTFQQVLWYTGRSGTFESSMQRMLPGDVVPLFRKAAFSVASKNYLDAMTRRSQTTHEGGFDTREKNEIQHIITLREANHLPKYTFNQDFVISLLMSNIGSTTLSVDVAMSNMPDLPEMPGLAGASSELYETVSVPTDHMMISGSMSTDTTLVSSTTRRASASSASSIDSGSSFFIPTTTQIRWPDIGRATKPGDFEKAKAAVLRYKCKSCNDGNKLTASEYQRHEDEHLHTLTCSEIGCKRRFCFAERG